MKSLRSRASVSSAVAMSLAIVMASAGPAAAHVETVIAFDPAASELPEGVTVEDGVIYTGLSPLGQLLRVPQGATEGEVIATLEGLGEGDFGLIGMTVREGDVYAAVMSANADLNGVWQFDTRTGDAVRMVGSEAIALPNDVAIGDDGTLYISDTSGGAVWRVPPGGSTEPWVTDELLQGTGDAGFGFPLGANGIDVHEGNVYVGVTETAQVVVVPIAEDGSAGEPMTLVQYEAPIDGVAVDAAGNVYGAHPLANLITMYTPEGALTTIATVDDGLDAPTSVEVATDPDGATILYIANFSVAMGGPLGAGPGILMTHVE